MRQIVLTVSLLAATSCTGADGGDRTTFQTRGDTTFAFNRLNGAEPPVIGLSEIGRAGISMGGPELLDIIEVAVDNHNGFYAFDRGVPIIRHFDSVVRHLGSIGRAGDGPGEYRAVTGLAVRTDGVLLAHDPQARRITLYAPSGAPIDHWLVNSGLFTSNSLSLTAGNDVYVRILVEDLPGIWKDGLLHLSQNGAVIDTVVPPTWHEGESQLDGNALSRRIVWAVYPTAVVVGQNDRYTFEVRTRDGVTVVSLDAKPVRLSDGEWQAHEARRRWDVAHESAAENANSRETPRVKPFYQAFTVVDDTLVWVKKHMNALAVPDEVAEPDGKPPLGFAEPDAYDVFHRNGRYLGQVLSPPGVTLLWLGSRSAIGTRFDDHAEQSLVKYRVSLGRPENSQVRNSH